MSTTSCYVLHCDADKCRETLHIPMPRQFESERAAADYFFQHVADAGWEAEGDRHYCWHHGRRGASGSPTPEPELARSNQRKR